MLLHYLFFKWLNKRLGRVQFNLHNTLPSALLKKLTDAI